MKSKCIETLNSLLRGERSALETYEGVIKNQDEGAPRVQLEQICSDHRDRVAELERHVISLGGKPGTSSGTWGVVASVVQTVANVIGDKTAVYSLKEGEELGLRSYESSLEDVSDEPECIHLINSCISAQRENLMKLQSILSEKPVS
jgi:uncharacterized protein (TIGR02284 family)